MNEQNSPIGVCDLILGFPDKNTAFIGPLLLSEKFQGKSLGRKCYQLIEDFSKDNQMQGIQLGCVENNPVEEFWNKMGFLRNGRSRPHQGLKV